jgi:hypothetical protein
MFHFLIEESGANVRYPYLFVSLIIGSITVQTIFIIITGLELLSKYTLYIYNTYNIYWIGPYGIVIEI